MIKPERLKRGDKVAIVSLSSGLIGEEKFVHKYDLGKKRLEEEFGLEVVAMPNALKGLKFIEEHPKFDIRPGLNLSNISIYHHNNFEGDIFPNRVDMGGEITISSDLLKVAKEYGEFYCLQDYTLSNGLTNVSLIRTSGNDTKIFTDNDGKVWEANELGFNLVDNIFELNEKIKYKKISRLKYELYN